VEQPTHFPWQVAIPPPVTPEQLESPAPLTMEVMTFYTQEQFDAWCRESIAREAALLRQIKRTADQQLRAQIERELRDSQRINTEERSWRLLHSLMSERQRRCFQRREYFYVHGGFTGHIYRIRRDSTYNIDSFNKFGVACARICALPMGVPLFDVMAAQLLHLQHRHTESAFLTRANIATCNQVASLHRDDIEDLV
jgi:hypothetical protein